MQHVEDFMRDFFRARLDEEKAHQWGRAVFRRKFFSESCTYGSRDRTIEMMESERIITVDSIKPQATVITESVFRHSGGNTKIRLRYRLQRDNATWLIVQVQRGCLMCEGRDDPHCPACKGNRWLETESEAPGK